MSLIPQLILVDEHDQIIWYEEKLKTHELGLLHRAFSIYLFDDQWRILLQQRAMSKYHAHCTSHDGIISWWDSMAWGKNILEKIIFN